MCKTRSGRHWPVSNLICFISHSFHPTALDAIVLPLKTAYGQKLAEGEPARHSVVCPPLWILHEPWTLSACPIRAVSSSQWPAVTLWSVFSPLWPSKTIPFVTFSECPCLRYQESGQDSEAVVSHSRKVLDFLSQHDLAQDKSDATSGEQF